MSNLALAGLSFLALFCLIGLRIPIGLAMLLCGLVGNVLVNDSFVPVMAQLKATTYETFSNYSLSIIPLFLLMGQFATRGGLSEALFRAAQSWLGHRRGGVAMASVGACAGFGAVCGSSLATAATMGQIALPELRRLGYSGALSTGALAAGGTLGILIPPSVILVIYAILTEQNIAELFVAAILPGLLAVLGYMIVVALYVRLAPAASGGTVSRVPGGRRKALLDVWPVVLIFLAVIGGIYAGIFTPTEGAAVGAAGTGIIALLRGGLDRTGLVDAILQTAVTTAMIFFIIIGANVFNSFLAFAQLPQAVAAWVQLQAYSPTTILIGILVCYFLFGCVMDSLSMIILTIPIFFPIVAGLEFGLGPEEFAIWFGILVLVSVEVGLITPPVGLNLYVINSIADDVPMSETFRGVLPFVVSDIARIGLLLAFPAISLILL